MLDRITPPPASKIDTIDLQQAVTYTLDNGAKLHVIEAMDHPIIRMEVIFQAGNWYESTVGTSYFGTKLLTEGTTRRSSNDISNIIDQYGASLKPDTGLDQVELQLTTLSEYFNNLCPLLRELTFDSNFPEEELDTAKNIRIQEIRTDSQKTSVVASKAIRKLLFGPGHPYGRSLTESDISGLEVAQVANFHQQVMTNNYEVVMTGRIEDSHRKIINQLFGQKPLDIKSNSTFYPIDGGLERQVIRKEGALQSSIRFGMIWPKKNHPDYIGLKVLSEILGGYFGSRLMMNIREDKGYTYGIFSHVFALRHESFFLIGTDVVKEFTHQTIEEIYKELHRLRTELVPTEELETVRNYMVGSFLSDISTPFSLAEKFKSVHGYGLGYEYYDNYLETINTITPGRLMELANTYLQQDQLTEVICGDITDA